jgi:hypothetical protein
MNLGDPYRIDVGRESMLHAETAAANPNESRHSTAETRAKQKSWTAWIADSDSEIVTRQSRAANDTRKRRGSSTTTMDMEHVSNTECKLTDSWGKTSTTRRTMWTV